MRKKYLSIVALFFLLSLLASNIPLYASGGLEVSPAFKEVILTQPNEEQEIILKLTNKSTKKISLSLFPIDFQQADEYGKIRFFKDGDSTKSFSLSSFIQLEANTIQIEPSETTKYKVYIKNRKDLSPGGHYAAVVAKVIIEGEETIVSPAVSTLLLIRKSGGERFHLSLNNVSWPDSTFVLAYNTRINLRFQNEGNVHLVPYGRVDIRDMFGRLLYKGIINTSSFFVYPSSRRIIPLDLQKIESSMPISINTIEITGQDSLKKTSYIYRGSFIYIHPMLLVIVGAIFIILIGSLIKKIRQSFETLRSSDPNGKRIRLWRKK